MSKSLTQDVIARYASDGSFITLMDLEGVAIPSASNVVTAEVNPVTGGLVNTVYQCTQAQYDAIVTKDAATLYVIVG